LLIILFLCSKIIIYLLIYKMDQNTKNILIGNLIHRTSSIFNKTLTWEEAYHLLEENNYDIDNAINRIRPRYVSDPNSSAILKKHIVKGNHPYFSQARSISPHRTDAMAISEYEKLTNEKVHLKEPGIVERLMGKKSKFEPSVYNIRAYLRKVRQEDDANANERKRQRAYEDKAWNRMTEQQQDYQVDQAARRVGASYALAGISEDDTRQVVPMSATFNHGLRRSVHGVPYSKEELVELGNYRENLADFKSGNQAAFARHSGRMERKGGKSNKVKKNKSKSKFKKSRRH
jgi:hypothetical protein